MKANELQIGDLVQIDGKIGHVSFISELGDISVFIDETQIIVTQNPNPIPLTAEILEKNGFVKRYNYQWEYRDSSCTIVISIAPQIEIDGEMLGTPPINMILEGALFDINMTSDMCVHNLQHALQLCGIEKEIII